MAFFAYILRNLDGRFFIGQTSDLELRLQRHNEGTVFWTKGSGPWSLMYTEEFPSRSEAIGREKGLKALKSEEELRKLMLSGGVPTRRDLRSQFCLYAELRR